VVVATKILSEDLRNLLKASSLRNICNSHSPPLLALTPTIHHTTMNYPNTTPADLSALSLWPDAPAVTEEEMAVWAQAAGYAQPGLDEGIPLDILDATLAWGRSGTSSAEFDFQNNFVSIFAFGK
jgi:hypothetical protein